MKRAALILAAALVLLLNGGQAKAVNLIVNGGFETGDFTGWTLSRNTTLFGVDHDAHSGNWAAFFGAVGSPTYLMQQTITTTPGATYTLDFWLKNDSGPSGANSVIFTAQFGNTQLINLTDPQ